MKLLVATGNAHKLEEFARILAPIGYEIVSPKEAGIDSEVEETGATFRENARIKALALFHLTGIATVADDSGLCVDALGGRPGVYSARYQGAGAPQSKKNAALLKELKTVKAEDRTARFVSAICCVLGSESILECEGVCEGTIGWEPRGEGGFGYDPLFMVGEKSFAELSGAEKDELSHRGRALRKLAGMLENQTNTGEPYDHN